MDNQENIQNVTLLNGYNYPKDLLLTRITNLFFIIGCVLALPGFVGVCWGFGVPLLIAGPGYALLWAYNKCRKNTKSIKFQTRTWLLSAIYNGLSAIFLASELPNAIKMKNMPWNLSAIVLFVYLVIATILSYIAYNMTREMKEVGAES